MQFWQNTVVPNLSSYIAGTVVLIAVILVWIIEARYLYMAICASCAGDHSDTCRYHA